MKNVETTTKAATGNICINSLVFISFLFLNGNYKELLDKPLYTDALQLIRLLVQQYAPCKAFIDGSAALLIHELKHGYDEYIQYEYLNPELLHSFISSACREPLIVPINFHYITEMAKHTVKVMAHHRVKTHPKFDKLITSLKSATTKDPSTCTCIVLT
jgi:hypothetical protein